MRKFVIATHGALAQGMKSSLDIIIGSVENLQLIQAYLDNNNPVEEEIKAGVSALGPGDELILFTDLLGGSISNQAMRQVHTGAVHVVAGFNLALLAEIMMASHDEPATVVIERAIRNAKEQMVYVNQLMAEAKTTVND